MLIPLTFVALAAVVAAVLIRRSSLDPGEDEGFAAAFLGYLRLWSWATVTGIAVGLPVLGLGLRLVMRVLAATSDVSVQGAFTDAGEPIGDITLGGTLGIVFFAGIVFGIAGGWLYAVVRPLLPDSGGLRVAAGATLGLVIGVPSLVNPDGRDFGLLRPTWLAVVLLAVVPALYGALLPVVGDRLRPVYERASLRDWSRLAFLPLLLVAPVFPVLVPTLLAGVAYAALRHRRATSGTLQLGRGILVAGIAALAALGVVRVASIETRDVRPSDFEDPFPHEG